MILKKLIWVNLGEDVSNNCCFLNRRGKRETGEADEGKGSRGTRPEAMLE